MYFVSTTNVPSGKFELTQCVKTNHFLLAGSFRSAVSYNPDFLQRSARSPEVNDRRTGQGSLCTGASAGLLAWRVGGREAWRVGAREVWRLGARGSILDDVREEARRSRGRSWSRDLYPVSQDRRGARLILSPLHWPLEEPGGSY